MLVRHVNISTIVFFANVGLTKQWEAKKNKQKINECKSKFLELRNPKALQTTLEIVKREKSAKC
jgi:hypothetical protein